MQKYLLETDSEVGQNPHRLRKKLLTLTYQRSEASATQPNPASLAKRLRESFPDVTSIMPHKHKTCLLIDAPDKSHHALLGTTLIDDTPVSIRETNHDMIISKGTVDLSAFPDMSEADLLEETKGQGVLEVKQIVRQTNGKSDQTSLFVLTFDKPEPPNKLKIDHLSLHVASRIPNPLRCFGCQWYGHTVNQCLRDPICARCSQTGHDSKNCQEPPLCLHCRSNHPTYDRTCPMYKIEKLILEKRFRDKVPFKEARKEVYLAHPDLTHKIPRLTKKTNPPPLEKRVTQSGMTYSQATSPNPDATKEPAITKATQDMIEALILTVEKQQEQITLLIGELTDMKSRFETKTESTSATQKTNPHNCEMETQTPSYQKVTSDTATQTKTCLHNSTETQTPYFNPTTSFSP